MRKYWILLVIAAFLASCGGSRLTKGDDLLQEGNLDEALNAYQDVLKEEPTDDERQEAQGRIAICYYRKGMNDLDAKKTDNAIVNFKKSGNKYSCGKLATIYFNKGNELFTASKYKEASENYQLSGEYSDKGSLTRESGLDEK
ncbi:MAG: tetratricopeptide repeat protein, partial [bacterium]|nr:tetratricopeptide repeat protein [bacterium]